MNKISLLILLIFLISCTNSKKNNGNNEIEKPEKRIESKENINTKTKFKIESISGKQKDLTIGSKILIPFNITKETKIGFINDSDGYSNLRENTNSNSRIITKISKDEYFFFNVDLKSEWYKVKDLKKNIGFVHKSLISEINDRNLYSISINSRPNPKDTLINVNKSEKIDFYILNDINYPEINLKSENKKQVTYSDSETHIKISKSRFDPKEHEIEYHEKYKNSTEKIDDIEIWGTDGGIPEYEISEITIINKDQNLTIQKSEIKNLFNPNLASTQIYKTNDKRIIIWMHNGDGAGAYSVIFFINEMELQKRVIYLPF